ncbi:SOS-response transcriptional repressor LexA [Sphingomonas sp. BK580]|nr:SOS-response transcriptional repressor LexA [Sphingomonas sp. BK580]
MGVSIAVITDGSKPISRRDEAYNFIRAYITRTGQSPSINNIMAALGVSKTRAKALVHQLAVANMIERVPGAQRGISIPGLFRELVLEELRREGYVVDKDILAGVPCPQGHLPLIAMLEHIPAVEVGDLHAQPSERRASSGG